VVTINSLVAYATAGLCGSLVAWALRREPRAFVQRVFGVGMLVLACRVALLGLGDQAGTLSEFVRWQHLRLLATGLLPGCWLLFSLSYARANFHPELARWKWVVLAMFVVPLTLATVFGPAVFMPPPLSGIPGGLLPLGWSGYALHLVLLLGSLLVLMQLERLLRASIGGKRRQIKFMVLGIGSVFAVQIYTCSQALLFSAVNPHIETLNIYATLVAALLAVVALVRGRLGHVQLYLSRTALYNSITVFMVGLYLLAVGSMAKAITLFGGNQVLPLAALFVFLAMVGISAVLLSEHVRHKVHRFVSRHFSLPRYDYRREWTRFTRATASIMDVKGLCTAIVNIVSETFRVSAVTLWLLDEGSPQRVTLGGSTTLSEGYNQDAEKGLLPLIEVLREHDLPVDLLSLPEMRHPLPYAGLRYGVILLAGGQALGVMTLGDRQPGETYTLEDLDLLKTIADQAAASLLNLRLSQHVVQAKQMETFQALSAFFVHDIKNLAAKLSLTMQNMQVHFDNPAFREHALQVLASSVDKMNAMCSRLSTLREKLELHRAQVDLNALVRETLAELDGALKATLWQDLQSLPRLDADAEQLQKILINLILNANDAVGNDGEIGVSTACHGKWVVVSVADNGCGMSDEFVADSLFRPFQTTKGKGLGIGLYHSKMIAEAHQGRLEVESQEGKGSTFRLFLPVATAGATS
jgi:putative PEP-CTERM system histidine kinase